MFGRGRSWLASGSTKQSRESGGVSAAKDCGFYERERYLQIELILELDSPSWHWPVESPRQLLKVGPGIRLSGSSARSGGWLDQGLDEARNCLNEIELLCDGVARAGDPTQGLADVKDVSNRSAGTGNWSSVF